MINKKQPFTKPLTMIVFAGEDSAKVIAEREVVDFQQAMYFVSAYQDDSVYGQIKDGPNVYIVGADCVERAF